MTTTSDGALIALDWGTSSLRAALLAADGGVLERRAREHGILSLPSGGFDAAYADIIDGWRAPHALACGMVGSAQGWREAPYVAAPAGAEEIAAALVRVRPQRGPPLDIVPGVIGADAAGAPNVMRGEETQIAGVAGRDGLFVLPGTHSKWVHVAQGRIGRFETFMTGELFGLLRTHSILGRALDPAAASRPFCRDAFTRGLVAARASRQGIAPLLFATRALVLTRQIRADESLDYLSGLLVGDELRAGLLHAGPAPCTLIGSPALVERYRIALDLFGAPPPHVVEDAATEGLRRIARAAGLLPEGRT